MRYCLDLARRYPLPVGVAVVLIFGPWVIRYWLWAIGVEVAR